LAQLKVTVRTELRDQPALQPNFASVRVWPELPRLSDCVLVRIGPYALGKSDAALTIQTINSIVGHEPRPRAAGRLYDSFRGKTNLGWTRPNTEARP
jgi:hypothetical protein